MKNGKDEPARSQSYDSRKRRRNGDDVSNNGAGGGDRRLEQGGRGHRGLGRGRGGRGRGRGGRCGQNQAHSSDVRTDSSRNISSRGRGAGRHHHNRNRNRGGRNGHNHRRNGNQSNHSFDATDATAVNVVSATSSETSFAESSDALGTTTNEQSHDKIVAVLPWANPAPHYIPVEEEERLLPVLIHWGKSERGMMKDQPAFRLQKIQKMLNGNEANKHGSKNHKSRPQKSDNNNKHQSESRPTMRISLVQSLSLRRHHLKLLNPTFPMSALRLGKEDDIRDAAALFEGAVDAYLRGHGVEYLTEEEQRVEFNQSLKGVPFRQRKQPPTPDFIMKDGHCAMISFTSNIQGECFTHPTSINWIEAKMFYGANTIPSGTPNAVGCILPKVKDYVSLYGPGAIVFMYGCGSELAAQLLEHGVVALDARGLNLDKVEKHQKRWCADGWGNILF
ncbi:hypothetical protein ACHAWF_002359 [Thalassiosira exigua]